MNDMVTPQTAEEHAKAQAQREAMARETINSLKFVAEPYKKRVLAIIHPLIAEATDDCLRILKLKGKNEQNSVKDVGEDYIISKQEPGYILKIPETGCRKLIEAGVKSSVLEAVADRFPDRINTRNHPSSRSR